MSLAALLVATAALAQLQAPATAPSDALPVSPPEAAGLPEVGPAARASEELMQNGMALPDDAGRAPGLTNDQDGNQVRANGTSPPPAGGFGEANTFGDAYGFGSAAQPAEADPGTGASPGGLGYEQLGAESTPLPEVPRLTVSDMLAEAIELPETTAIEGRQLSLQDVLEGVTDRSKRIEIVHAYWQLCRKLGEYRIVSDELARIDLLNLEPADSLLLQLARQKAERDAAAAELALLQTQFALAEAADLPSTSPLPLPMNLPHAGTYDTRFDEVFAERPPTAAARLLDRTLPLQYRLIGLRTETVLAAEDALKVIARSYQFRQADASDILAALSEITDQRRKWMSAVSQYNESIADYALAIASPHVTGRDLVSLLINLDEDRSPKQKTVEREPSSRASDVADNDIVRSEDAQPVTTEEHAQAGRPTLAPPRDRPAERATLEEKPSIPIDELADPDRSEEPAASESPQPLGAAADSNVRPTVLEIPLGGVGTPVQALQLEDPTADQAASAAEAPGRAVADGAGEKTADAEGNAPENRLQSLVGEMRPLVPIRKDSETAVERTVNRQPLTATEDSVLRRYGDLDAGTPSEQAKGLTAVFFVQAERGSSERTAMKLEDCLRDVDASRRGAVVEGYWRASLQLARCKAHRQHAELLDDLLGSINHGEAGSASAAARLKAARIEVEADLLQSERSLLEARYELTRLCRRSLEEGWVSPETQPHAGVYYLKLESQPARLADSWRVRRLAATIPGLATCMRNRAQAVVAADRRRTQRLASYPGEMQTFDELLRAVEEQTGETFAFLEEVTAYNQSIADYAVAVVPANVPGELFAATLVMPNR